MGAFKYWYYVNLVLKTEFFQLSDINETINEVIILLCFSGFITMLQAAKPLSKTTYLINMVKQNTNTHLRHPRKTHGNLMQNLKTWQTERKHSCRTSNFVDFATLFLKMMKILFQKQH